MKNKNFQIGKKSAEKYEDLLKNKSQHTNIRNRERDQVKDFKLKFNKEESMSESEQVRKINNVFEEDDKVIDDMKINVEVDRKQKKKTNTLFSNDFIAFPSKADKTVVEEPLDNFSHPWLTNRTRKMTGMLKLHYEILDFFDFIKPTEEEDELRTRTFDIIKSLIDEINPNWKVKMFGSFPNKIHLPDSDIDLIVLTDDESEAIRVLKKVAKKLKDSDSVSFINLIDARVPIVKAQIKETGINVDIR
jgi:hypothetical protein